MPEAKTGHSLDARLRTALALAPRASDFLLVPGQPLMASTDGSLTPLAPDPLAGEETRTLAGELLGADRRLTTALAERGACDLSYRHPDGVRFRANVFRTM